MEKYNSVLAMLMLTSIFLFASCKKNTTQDNPPDPTPTPITADVYIVGYDRGPLNGTRVAKLWKNGVATDIETNASANGVYVEGNDVYVALVGTHPNFNKPRAKLWKNGQIYPLIYTDYDNPLSESYSEGMCKGVVVGNVSASNGTGNVFPGYWSSFGTFNQISVSSSNLYATDIDIKTINNYTRTSISGFMDGTNSLVPKKAFYWGGQFSNPSVNIISNATSYGYCSAINDNGFTFIGGKQGTPIVWSENGGNIILSNNIGNVNDLFVVGYNDVYAVGEELVNGTTPVAKLWHGDFLSGRLEPVDLVIGSGMSSAFDIKVINGNTFICGYEYGSDGKSYAKYWKNGESTTLGGPNSVANAIYVVKK